MASLAIGPATSLEQVCTAWAENPCRCTGSEAIYGSVIAVGKERVAMNRRVLPVAQGGVA